MQGTAQGPRAQMLQRLPRGAASGVLSVSGDSGALLCVPERASLPEITFQHLAGGCLCLTPPCSFSSLLLACVFSPTPADEPGLGQGWLPSGSQGLS